MPDTLEAMLSWVQGFIRLEAQPSEEEIARVVRPSATLTSAQRLAIYREQHWLKLRDALARDLKGVQRFMGPEAFHHFVQTYAFLHPPRTHDIHQLRDGVVEFLAAVPEFPFQGFVVELCRLEVACAHLAALPWEEALTVEALAAGDWPHEKFVMVAASRLMTLQYRVHEFLRAEEQATREAWGEESPNHLLLVRRDRTVWRLPLSPEAFALLERLHQGSTPLQAVEELGISYEDGRLAIAEWARLGVFARAVPGADAKPLEVLG